MYPGRGDKRTCEGKEREWSLSASSMAGLGRKVTHEVPRRCVCFAHVPLGHRVSETSSTGTTRSRLRVPCPLVGTASQPLLPPTVLKHLLLLLLRAAVWRTSGRTADASSSTGGGGIIIIIVVASSGYTPGVRDVTERRRERMDDGGEPIPVLCGEGARESASTVVVTPFLFLCVQHATSSET